MMHIFLLILTASASEIFVAKDSDGNLKFTDSPDHGGYVVFDVNGPPPLPTSVNLERFPLLDVWDDYLHASSQKHSVPIELLKAICVAESGMNPSAHSKAGAIGLMQLMPQTAEGLGVKDPWDPQQNIEGGALYIRKQIDRFGDYELALAAYNAGPGNVRKYNGIPPFEETQVYVKRVMSIYNLFIGQPASP
jgi:soluble lytic murein transglycosylase-like protein